jgi:hypothetical protein
MSGLLAHLGMLFGLGSAVPHPWDAASKGAAVTLSGSDLIATTNNSRHSVRSVTGHGNTGDFYAEVTVSGAALAWIVGVASAAHDFTGSVGSDLLSFGYASGGNKINNSSASAYGANWFTQGTVIGILLSGGSLTFYKNGVSQGVAFSGLGAGPWFVAWSANGPFDGIESGTLNTGQSALSLPGGSVAWG